VLTLKNIQRRPEFAGGGEIKVSRGAVARTIMVTNVSVKRDALLRRLFDFAWRELPHTRLGPEWSRCPPPVPGLVAGAGLCRPPHFSSRFWRACVEPVRIPRAPR